MCDLMKFRSRGVVILLWILLFMCIVFGAVISTVAVLVAYGKSEWCVETRKTFYIAVTGREPPIPSDFTGTWRVRWRDGCLKEIEARDGMPHGRYTFWNEEGRKDEEGFYKNGKKDGKWTAWHHNGNKWMEWYCKNGMDHGKSIEWDFDGNLVSVTWKYKGHIVSKDEFEKLTAQAANNK